MPSTWSSRLLSGGSSSVVVPTSNHRNKPLPRPPTDSVEPPTLNAESAKPRAQAARQHAHSRSVSHPLPKIFGRKKSAGNFHDTDVPLDDDLVPVLNAPAPKKPARVISQKRNQVDEDGKATRACMCCDSKCKVPHELLRFRCLCCLTINDLKPAEEQAEEDKSRPHPHRTTTDPVQGHLAEAPAPISLEKTRAIIDRCVLTYLEARCQRRSGAEIPRALSPRDDVFGPDQLSNAFAVGQHNAEHPVKGLANTQLSTSPPSGSQDAVAISMSDAAIREQSDFKQFGGSRIDSPAAQHLSAHSGPGPPRLIAQEPVPTPVRPNRKPPPPVQMPNRRPSHNLLPPQNEQLTPSARHNSPRNHQSPRLTAEEAGQRREYDRIKSIFRPLEDYLVASFGDFRCLNSSFSTNRPTRSARTRSESEIKTPIKQPPAIDWNPSPMDGLSELDAKTLLLGDIGENGTWWTGRLASKETEKATRRKRVGEGPRRAVSSKSPNINWNEVASWYDAVHFAGGEWRAKRNYIVCEGNDVNRSSIESDIAAEEIDDDMADAREHAIRTLLKITENLLKRPSRPLKEPEDLRWLLIMLANPSLYPPTKPQRTRSRGDRYLSRSVSDKLAGKAPASPVKRTPGKSPGRVGSQHNGLLKRIFGLLAHSTENCHRYMIGWYSRLDEEMFVKHVDLVASFVTYRVDRRSGRPRGKSGAADNGLIPDLSGSSMNTSAQLHTAMGLSGSVKKGKNETNAEPDWTSDWQVKAAAKVMSILFTANNIWQGKRREPGAARINTHLNGGDLSPSAKAKRSGQLLHTSSFYNTLLDYLDMIEDFKEWEKRRDKFSFCQYPLFISIGTKIKILEFDAQRQMALKAREAYFDQIFRSQRNDGYFHLRVRRDCIVDDSLRQISEAVGAGQEDLKKGMRVHFAGEEGVDAGGPRKEWFLILVRDIFDPNHGMFVYDDESNTCYFNPNSFETSDQYHLVGVLLGLAIYNSTILDVALPPFAFRKLLAAAPTSLTGTTNSNVSSLTGTKGQMTYSLQDLAEFRPSLAAGLQQLLDYDGNVQETYCRDFVASVERYGTVQSIPLIPNGENVPVTNANRHEFVDAYVRYLLDTAVARQFEPFKRGFFTVCAGNALSLFRAEEIELLIRGSDEALDVDSLRAVAQYENWRHFQPPHPLIDNPAEQVPVIGWFWELFSEASPEKQRKLLTFITGSDRIPAVGATSLILRIQAGGDGWGGGGIEERKRFPVARTCFNMLVLWRYDYREQLEGKLWRAVEESEGFGLK